LTPSQQTLDQVVKKYNIDTTYMKGGRAFYNPYQDAPGSTTIADQLVTIGPDAFASEPYLAAVVGHEAVHSYDLGLTRGLYLTRSMTELNATSSMLNNATAIYNTSAEIAEFQRYYDFWAEEFWYDQYRL
jgi:hypothetical protein